jgi:hypothetical protein
VAQLYPQAPGSLSVASYDSQGYGGGILTRLHAGNTHTHTHTHVLFITCQELGHQVPPESLDTILRKIKSDISDYRSEIFNSESGCEWKIR